MNALLTTVNIKAFLGYSSCHNIVIIIGNSKYSSSIIYSS